MCDDREKLIAYLYDDAEASDRRQVEAHLSECATCREELRGLRAVREDLLAWDVPAHESVWKPFATGPLFVPWWRHVPAWGLAAVAMLVFGIGLAGGVAARALTSSPVPIQAQAQPQPASVAPAPAPAATPAQLELLEQRLASLERSGAGRATPVSLSASFAASEDLKLQVQQWIKDSEGRASQRTTRKLLDMLTEFEKQRLRDMASVQQQISDAQAQTNGNLVRVMNARGPVDKEKEQ